MILAGFRRNRWQNRDAGVRWAVKKDAPAGKFVIKRAVNALNIVYLTMRKLYVTEHTQCDNEAFPDYLQA